VKNAQAKRGGAWLVVRRSVAEVAARLDLSGGARYSQAPSRWESRTMTEPNKVQNAIQIAIVVLTACAAALGVQINPAAKPQEVAQVVRDELQPLKQQVSDLATAQQAQGLRLAKVEVQLSIAHSATVAP
jgi:hypothetical protein